MIYVPVIVPPRTKDASVIQLLTQAVGVCCETLSANK